MSNVMQAINNDVGMMPFVRFERIAVEDKAGSLAVGHYVAKDVDMANITPPFSKDVMKYKVVSWFEQMAIDAQNGRIPPDWLEKYKATYEAWKNGQELPVDGVPIRGWGMCSPAQQETMIKMHILTVEQLAEINHEGIVRIGMGGVDLKNKAIAWLKQLKKTGPVALENAEFKRKVEQQDVTITNLQLKIDELTLLVERLSKSQPIQAVSHEGLSISADDLMSDD